MSEDIQKKLKENREAIDGIDRDVVRLLCERVQHAAEIGQIKNAHGADFYDPVREAQVMDKIAALNPGTIPEKTLRAIYREVISGSIALEKRMVIAYLGPEATTHTKQQSKALVPVWIIDP